MAGLEAVERRVADDVHAVGLVDRERVVDGLVRSVEWTEPSFGFTQPTLPLFETNQIRPFQSGSAETIPSPAPTTPLTS